MLFCIRLAVLAKLHGVIFQEKLITLLILPPFLPGTPTVFYLTCRSAVNEFVIWELWFVTVLNFSILCN